MEFKFPYFEQDSCYSLTCFYTGKFVMNSTDSNLLQEGLESLDLIQIELTLFVFKIFLG